MLYWQQLTFTTVWSNLDDDKFVVFVIFFPENRIWHFMQIVFMETICMKCQNMFSGKNNKKNISKCRLLKFLPRVLSAYFSSCYTRLFGCLHHINVLLIMSYRINHYENTPIQIYWKFHHQKLSFLDKNSDIFHITALKHRLWYSLEPPHWGGSNEYHNLCFWAEIRKIMYTPVNPSFTI